MCDLADKPWKGIHRPGPLHRPGLALYSLAAEQQPTWPAASPWATNRPISTLNHTFRPWSAGQAVGRWLALRWSPA
jgi:hypothetical protein